MDTKLDSRVTELLCARLCHDLISPVAAINNGIELVTQFEDEMQGEALGLIGASARDASEKLQFFRVALGSGRSADGAGIGLAEARERTLRALGSERITIDWQVKPEIDGLPVSRAGIKIVLNLIWLSTEVLPGMGKISVNLEKGSEDQPHDLMVEILVAQEGFSLPKEYEEHLLSGAGVENLTPKTVQAYYTRFLTEMSDSHFQVKPAPNCVIFSAGLPLDA